MATPQKDQKRLGPLEKQVSKRIIRKRRIEPTRRLEEIRREEKEENNNKNRYKNYRKKGKTEKKIWAYGRTGT